MANQPRDSTQGHPSGPCFSLDSTYPSPIDLNTYKKKTCAFSQQYSSDEASEMSEPILSLPCTVVSLYLGLENLFHKATQSEPDPREVPPNNFFFHYPSDLKFIFLSSWGQPHYWVTLQVPLVANPRYTRIFVIVLHLRQKQSLPFSACGPSSTYPSS